MLGDWLAWLSFCETRRYAEMLGRGREAVDGPPSRSSLPDSHPTVPATATPRGLSTALSDDATRSPLLRLPAGKFLSINQGTVTAAANETAGK
jgi:hypothetical protein